MRPRMKFIKNEQGEWKWQAIDDEGAVIAEASEWFEDKRRAKKDFLIKNKPS